MGRVTGVVALTTLALPGRAVTDQAPVAGGGVGAGLAPVEICGNCGGAPRCLGIFSRKACGLVGRLASKWPIPNGKENWG